MGMKKRLRQWTSRIAQIWTAPVAWVAGVAAALSPMAKSPAQAQVVPTADGVGTTVTESNGQFDIDGGTQAGGNLFHEFDEFSVGKTETANFLTDSGVFNVVGQVSQANPSYIDGTVQVSGSEANLYLINPSGVLFGPDAQLSLSGSFTASTADQVEFDGEVLNVLDNGTDYSALTEDPSAFLFTDESASAVVNQADLSVDPGESISLVGGTVVNAGDVSASGGEIGLVAVEGESTVRYGIPGSLLSLEVEESALPGASFMPTDLPDLITGSTTPAVNELRVMPDGTVELRNFRVEAGEVAVTGEISTRSRGENGGAIALLGNTVDIVDAVVDASGESGGDIRIGGDFGGQGRLPTAEAVLLNRRSTVLAEGTQGAGGDVSIWSDGRAYVRGRVSAQGTTSGGTVETSASHLDLDGFQLEASGLTQGGRWIIDPVDVEIVASSTGFNQIETGVIEAALDSGTDVEIATTTGAGGNGDIFLLDSIDQTGGGSANLTLTGRRFETNGSTIDLSSTGQLTFNVNQVNPEATPDSSSIAEALDAIGNVSGRRLINLGSGDYRFANRLTLNTDVDIEGAGAGNTTLSALGSYRHFAVDDGVEVALRELTLTTSGLAAGQRGGGIENTGQLFVDDVHFVDNRATNGGAIASHQVSALNPALLTIVDSEFRDNSAQNGGAISLFDSATTEISNTLFENNSVVGDGGALRTSESALRVDGNSRFVRNSAGGSGGALAVRGVGNTVFDTVAFEENTAGNYGGALTSWRGAIISFENATLSQNQANRSGGALSLIGNSVVDISASAFVSNSALQDGGAIRSNDATVDIVDGTFSNNEAIAGSGGAVHSDRSTLTVESSDFQNNSAQIYGGGIRAQNTVLTIGTGSLFDGNMATAADGGGVSLSGGATVGVVDDVTFTNNFAGSDGGGLSAADDSRATVRNGSRFLSNLADDDGGGLYVSLRGALTISDAEIDSNSAVDSGGGVYVSYGSSMIASDITVNNNAASDGGGISLKNGATANIGGVAVISNNRASDDGGGLFLSSGATGTIEDVRIENNTADDDGGGVYTHGNNTRVVINDARLENNEANNEGGGLLVSFDSEATITATTFDNNEARVGGAVRVLNATAGIAGGRSRDVVNNRASAQGGAIALENSTVTLNNLEIADNTSNGDGGAIALSGTTNVALSDTTFADNAAGDQGGAVYNEASGNQQIVEAAFTRNTAISDGGAIAHNTTTGSLSLRNSTFTENTTQEDGGALYTRAGSNAALEGSRFIRNQANDNGGAAYLAGDTTVENSEFQDNSATQGGGIQVAAGSTLTAAGSTLEGNQAVDGGGLFNQGTASLVNTTLSGNIATNDGGAIKTFAGSARLAVRNSTLTQNRAASRGGGLFEQGTQSASLLNTIVADNSSPIATDVSGTFVDQGGNLIGVSDGAIGLTNSTLVGAAASPIDPGLAPLADNGGLTRTHLLRVDSVAVNAGRATNLPTVDQRGQVRFFGSNVDIGATELGVNGPTPIGTTLGVPITASPAVGSLNGTFFDPTLPSTGLNGLGRVSFVRKSHDLFESNQAIRRLEQSFSRGFADYWDLAAGPDLTFDEVQAILRRAQEEYEVNSAVIYATFVPEDPAEADEDSILQIEPVSAGDDLLNLSVVLPEGELVSYELPVTRSQASRQVRLLRSTVSDPDDRGGYRPLTRQLYQWLLAPIEEDLAAQDIHNLMYALDDGLRTAPIAAMRDYQGFSLERYGISVVPSVGLMQADFPISVRRSTVAMGISEFVSDQPLPAVPVELEAVKAIVPVSQTVLNEGSTVQALASVQALEQPGVLHLATHATFDNRSAESSYIQMWDQPLSMKDFSTLGWGDSDLELLILSACSTALSGRNSELGFAGLAAAAGVDATVGSLWEVSDVGTLALMSEFYAQLESTDVRFEALRQAQLSLLRGETRIEGGDLVTSRGTVDLPDEWDLPNSATIDHPFFWSAFTMIGNPW